jgi:hypothetical protein
VDVDALRKTSGLGYIKDPDGITARTKFGDKVPPDEPTATGDQDLCHRNCPLAVELTKRLRSAE